MIIQCKSCSRKFVVKDQDVPENGRTVQCGYCSVTWHQMPVSIETKSNKKKDVASPIEEVSENLSVDKIKASDGKTYKFLGTQWVQLSPSGKTGLFAKKKIGKELDKLTGRKEKSIVKKRKKKIKEAIDPLSESLDNLKQLPDLYKPKQGLGLFGYIFLLIIIGFSIVGILRTFENDLLLYFPQTEYVFLLLDEQLAYFSETVKNMIVIVDDLINSY